MIFKIQRKLIGKSGMVLSDMAVFQREDSFDDLSSFHKTWVLLSHLNGRQYTWEVIDSWEDGDLGGEVLLTQQNNSRDNYEFGG